MCTEAWSIWEQGLLVILNVRFICYLDKLLIQKVVGGGPINYNHSFIKKWKLFSKLIMDSKEKMQKRSQKIEWKGWIQEIFKNSVTKIMIISWIR